MSKNHSTDRRIYSLGDPARALETDHDRPCGAMTTSADPGAGMPRLDQAVEDIMGRWPATARVFIRRKMACVGCIMAPFQTLAAAARAYHVPESELLVEMQAAAAGDLEDTEEFI